MSSGIYGKEQEDNRMKVLLINGSPHENGCTYTALQEIADTFQKEQILADIFWIGNKPIYSCKQIKIPAGLHNFYDYLLGVKQRFIF